MRIKAASLAKARGTTQEGNAVSRGRIHKVKQSELLELAVMSRPAGRRNNDKSKVGYRRRRLVGLLAGQGVGGRVTDDGRPD